MSELKPSAFAFQVAAGGTSLLCLACLSLWRLSKIDKMQNKMFQLGLDTFRDLQTIDSGINLPDNTMDASKTCPVAPICARHALAVFEPASVIFPPSSSLPSRGPESMPSGYLIALLTLGILTTVLQRLRRNSTPLGQLLLKLDVATLRITFIALQGSTITMFGAYTSPFSNICHFYGPQAVGVGLWVTSLFLPNSLSSSSRSGLHIQVFCQVCYGLVQGLWTRGHLVHALLTLFYVRYTGGDTVSKMRKDLGRTVAWGFEPNFRHVYSFLMQVSRPPIAVPLIAVVFALLFFKLWVLAEHLGKPGQQSGAVHGKTSTDSGPTVVRNVQLD